MIVHVCPAYGCKTITDGGRCPTHRRNDNTRRNAKSRAHGLATPRWHRLRRAQLACEPTCADCGADATTVHLNPDMGGDHWSATLDDLTSLCARCHGRRDQPRAVA